MFQFVAKMLIQKTIFENIGWIDFNYRVTSIGAWWLYFRYLHHLQCFFFWLYLTWYLLNPSIKLSIVKAAKLPNFNMINNLILSFGYCVLLFDFLMTTKLKLSVTVNVWLVWSKMVIPKLSHSAASTVIDCWSYSTGF